MVLLVQYLVSVRVEEIIEAPLCVAQYNSKAPRTAASTVTIKLNYRFNKTVTGKEMYLR